MRELSHDIFCTQNIRNLWCIDIHNFKVTLLVWTIIQLPLLLYTAAVIGSSSSLEGGKMVKSRPDISSVPPLNELITEEQYKALSEMAGTLKTTFDPQLGENVCLGETELEFEALSCYENLATSDVPLIFCRRDS